MASPMATVVDGVAFASAARTASPTPFEITQDWAKFLTVTILATAGGGGATSIVFNVDFFDPASGTWILVLASAAVTAPAAATVLRIGPSLPVTANIGANAPLTGRTRIRPVHAEGTSITYSVGYSIT